MQPTNQSPPVSLEWLAKRQTVEDLPRKDPMSTPLKKLTIKMFAPGNRTHKTIILAAGKCKVFKPGGEFDVLSNVADSLETQFPNDEFRFVQVGPAAFNFVWQRKKTLEEVADRVMIGGMHLGEVATVEVGSGI